MRRFIGLSHLLLILLLLVQPVPAQITSRPTEDSPRVMTLIDVWNKSMCQPMEQLVDVEQEFPGEVEYIYIPYCVPLKRCSGCCVDEGLDCHPTLKRNITMQIKRITPMRSSNDVELTFVEHQSCECRRRQNPQKEKSSSVSITNKPQRKNKKTAHGCSKCQFPRNKIKLH